MPRPAGAAYRAASWAGGGVHVHVGCLARCGVVCA